MGNPPLRSVNPTVRDAMTRRLHRRSVVNGTITLPAVAGMIDEYGPMCGSLFTTVGVSGRDVFDLPREERPIEMCWLVYQKPDW
jgi:hypothetical protein